MEMREIFVTELVKDILGPRNGAGGLRERLTNVYPVDEFMTGVLAPLNEKKTENPDEIAVLPKTKVNDSVSYEEDDPDEDIDISSMLSPALDPKKKPSTMGISFFVKAQETINLKICTTWARYLNPDENQDNVWQREPRSAVLTKELEPQANETEINLDDKGEEKKSPEILLKIFVRPQKAKDHYFVSIFLVNLIKKGDDERFDASHYIFQPQIRVVCGNNTEIFPGFARKNQTPDDEKLEFLYRNQPFLARGHLVSAIWRSIDPERSAPNNSLDYNDASKDPPFNWVDGDMLSNEEKKLFNPPDVRTEFVPLYSIPSPEILWTDEKK